MKCATRSGATPLLGASIWIAALITATPLDAQVSVDELEVFLRSDGGSATGLARVTNETDRPVQVLVELQDWRRDPFGINEFRPLGSLPSSCGDRLEVFPPTLRLEARETQAIRVTFAGAPDTSCWNVVFVQTNEPQSAARGSQITYLLRTGIKVYVEASRASRDGEIDAVRQLPDSAQVRRAEISFRNTGEAHLKPTGALEVRRPDDSLAARVSIPEFYLEPRSSRRLSVSLPALPPGQYVLLALLDYGGPDIAAGQLELVVR